MYNYSLNKITFFIIAVCFFPLKATTAEWKYYYKDSSQENQPKRIALIVGINDFDDPFWPDLKFAAKDANDLALALTNKESNFNRVVLLETSDLTDRKTIIQKLNDLLLENTKREDTVLIYFSTHGTIIPMKHTQEFQQFLIVRDTDENDIPQTGISLATIHEKFNLLKSQRKLLIIASCYSGIGKSKFSSSTQKDLTGIKGAPVLLPFNDVSEASIILSASRITESAKEDAGLQNDIYTHFLIKSFQEKSLSDKNKDGAISALEAHDFAKELTYLYTKGEQIPTAQVNLAGSDPVILSGAQIKDPNPSLYSYATQFEKYSLFANGTKKGSFPGFFSLEPGTYMIEVKTEDNEVVFKDKISLNTNTKISLEKIIKPKPNEIEFKLGPSYFFGNQWKEKVGLDYGYDLSLGYTHHLMTLLKRPLKIASEIHLTETFEQTLDDTINLTTQFYQLSYTIAPSYTLFQNYALSAQIFAGAGFSYAHLVYSIEDRDSADTSYGPIYLGGLRFFLRVANNIFIVAMSDIRFVPLAFTTFGDIAYTSIGEQIGVVTRF